MTGTTSETMPKDDPLTPDEPQKIDAALLGDVPSEPVNQTAAAKRALEEAEQRRLQRESDAKREAEVGGQRGPDPVRYGDWEKGGIAWDF